MSAHLNKLDEVRKLKLFLKLHIDFQVFLSFYIFFILMYKLYSPANGEMTLIKMLYTSVVDGDMRFTGNTALIRSFQA